MWGRGIGAPYGSKTEGIMRGLVLLCLLACLVTSTVVEPDYVHLLEEFDENSDGLLNSSEFEHFVEFFLSLEASDPHEHGHASEHTEDEHASEHTEDEHASEHTDEHECETIDELFAEFDYNMDSQLNDTEFRDVSPALMLMIRSGCKLAHEESCGEVNNALAWLAAVGSAIFISLTSFVGILFVAGKRFIGIASIPLTAFAVGSLFGDAVLHLIPEAVGLHSHGGHGGHGGHSEPAGEFDYVWRLLVVLFGFMFFFVLEREHRKLDKLFRKVARREKTTKQHAKDGPPHPQQDGKIEFGKNVAFVIIFSDMIHNFVDGVAIGISFASGYGLGVATLIAIICHEIPQEFSDFFILLESGLSKWKALLWNFASGVTCILGSIVGMLVLDGFEGAEPFIVAFVAGNFIYVSLVDLTPKLLEFQKPSSKYTIVMAVAISLGIVIMLIIALFLEELDFC